MWRQNVNSFLEISKKCQKRLLLALFSLFFLQGIKGKTVALGNVARVALAVRLLAVDLEKYDYTKGASSLIRATASSTFFSVALSV